MWRTLILFLGAFIYHKKQFLMVHVLIDFAMTAKYFTWKSQNIYDIQWRKGRGKALLRYNLFILKALLIPHWFTIMTIENCHIYVINGMLLPNKIRKIIWMRMPQKRVINKHVTCNINLGKLTKLFSGIT